MTIEQQSILVNRWIEGRCPICDKEIRESKVPKVTVNCQGVDVDICASHPRP